MSVQKVFQFEHKYNGSSLYLHGPDNANPETILNLYIKWYNEEFAPEEHTEFQAYDEYMFICSFCPIDFYDEYKELKNDR